jgi:hypothetical protein
MRPSKTAADWKRYGKYPLHSTVTSSMEPAEKNPVAKPARSIPSVPLFAGCMGALKTLTTHFSAAEAPVTHDLFNSEPAVIIRQLYKDVQLAFGLVRRGVKPLGSMDGFAQLGPFSLPSSLVVGRFPRRTLSSRPSSLP